MEKCGHWVAQYNKKIYFNKGIDTCPYCLIDKLRADLDAAVRELQEENAAMRMVVDAARGDMGFAESRINLEAALDALDAGKEEP